MIHIYKQGEQPKLDGLTAYISFEQLKPFLEQAIGLRKDEEMHTISIEENRGIRVTLITKTT